MELAEANRLNEETLKTLRERKLSNHADAMALGIMALRRIIAVREDATAFYDRLLPGETLPASTPGPETWEDIAPRPEVDD